MNLSDKSQALAEANVPDYWRAYQSELASRHRREQARLNRRNLIVGWACMLAVMAMVAYAMVGSL